MTKPTDSQIKNDINLYEANPFGGLSQVTPGGSGESDHTYNVGHFTEYVGGVNPSSIANRRDSNAQSVGDMPQ